MSTKHHCNVCDTTEDVAGGQDFVAEINGLHVGVRVVAEAIYPIGASNVGAANDTHLCRSCAQRAVAAA